MTTTDIRIVPVTTKKERRTFAAFPWRIYEHDPYWVPPIFMDRLALLDVAKHPFWQHADQQLFLAMRGPKVVGTVGAHINHRHNDLFKDKVGFFGFFEVVQDYAVAQALLDAAAQWLRERGMDAMRGPENPSQNEECGLLVDGFDSPPVVQMTYNPRYYQEFMERYGLQKAQDLYAWNMRTNIFEHDVKPMPRKSVRVADQVRQRPGLVLRNFNPKNWHHEVEEAKILYNKAWEQNWGFVPMTDAEIEHLANEIRMFLVPELIFFAEVNGEPAGISLGLPDVYQALIRARPQPNVWSLPLTLARFLWHRRKVNVLRLLIMGVVPEYRGQGLDALFYVETGRNALRKGYKFCEMSWILESNEMMNRIIERLGGQCYKTYRIYQKPL